MTNLLTTEKAVSFVTFYLSFVSYLLSLVHGRCVMSETQIGRTPEVSDEVIIRAGNALRQQERRVTGFALRKAVGNKGDASRLLRVCQSSLYNVVIVEDVCCRRSS